MNDSINNSPDPLNIAMMSQEAMKAYDLTTHTLSFDLRTNPSIGKLLLKVFAKNLPGYIDVIKSMVREWGMVVLDSGEYNVEHVMLEFWNDQLGEVFDTRVDINNLINRLTPMIGVQPFKNFIGVSVYQYDCWRGNSTGQYRTERKTVLHFDLGGVSTAFNELSEHEVIDEWVALVNSVLRFGDQDKQVIIGMPLRYYTQCKQILEILDNRYTSGWMVMTDRKSCECSVFERTSPYTFTKPLTKSLHTVPVQIRFG